MKIPVTALVITRNEELAIGQCIDSLHPFEQIIVIDSNSSDETARIAIERGAEVVNFTWNGKYPKKKQSALDLPAINNHWVILIDADERVPLQLAEEISSSLSTWEDSNIAIVEVPLRYFWLGKELRHGYQVRKCSVLDRRHARFPEVNDLWTSGGNEVEGHYQPITGKLSTRTRHQLIHLDPDPFADWVARHNRYSDWESDLAVIADQTGGSLDRTVASRSGRGKFFHRLPLKSLVFFVYSFVLRGGFLDGSSGFDYAVANSFYYWMIAVKIKQKSRFKGTALRPLPENRE